MKRFLPDSLAAWALLILIAGLIIIQISTLAVFLQDRVQNGRMMGFFHLAQRVSALSRTIANEPDPVQRRRLAGTLSDPTMIVRVEPRPLATSAIASDDEIAELEDILQARLTEAGIADIHVERRAREDVRETEGVAQLESDAGPVERGLSEIAELYARDDAYVASIQLQDSSWLNYVIAIAPSERLWTPNRIVLAALVVALVLAASIWSLRRLTGPYGLLANAAERLGLDLNAAPLPEKGPRELRGAAHAFNLMRERLQRLVGDRNQMVAAISHDLRTPLTRLRLRADFVEESEQRGRMLADLDEIEMMTRSVLAFASDSAEPERRETIDIISLLDTIAEDTPGVMLALPLGLPPRLPYAAQPVALRRCIANLVENAIKYGKVANLSLAVEADAIRIIVEDDGPGIAAEDIETVFRPFRRLETSRNRETGGTGLGLTIARSVARAHGGDVTLVNRPDCGLRAEIVLPLAGA
jgi:signal transduction histidine kinase